MDYKQTIAITLVATSVGIGGGVGGYHAVKQYDGEQEVKAEISVNIDEKELADNIADNLTAHANAEMEYKMALAERRGCIRNRDNEYYVAANCKGVDF